MRAQKDWLGRGAGKSGTFNQETGLYFLLCYSWTKKAFFAGWRVFRDGHENGRGWIQNLILAAI